MVYSIHCIPLYVMVRQCHNTSQSYSYSGIPWCTTVRLRCVTTRSYHGTPWYIIVYTAIYYDVPWYDRVVTHRSRTVVYHGVYHGIPCFTMQYTMLLVYRNCRPISRHVVAVRSSWNTTNSNRRKCLPSDLDFRLRAISHYCTVSAVSSNVGMK